MKNILTLALVGSIAALTPAAADTKSPARKNAERRSKAAAAEAREARVAPHFEAAWKKLEAGSPAASATEISSAAVKMRNLTADSKLKEAGAVNASAAELDQLSAGISQKKITGPAQLEKPFARAHQRLAAFQQARAQALLDADDEKTAGTALNRTADHIENAAKWSGETLTDAGKATVTGLRKVAGGLVSGTGAIVEGTGTVLKKSVGLVTKLGNRVKGAPAPATGHLGKDAVSGTRKVTGGTVEGVGKVGEAGAGVVEKAGEGLKKTGDKVSGKK